MRSVHTLAAGILLALTAAVSPAAADSTRFEILSVTRLPDHSVAIVVYSTRGAYETVVRRAAAYAVLQRWMLLDDIDAVVTQALARPRQFPGCVPEH